MSERAKEEEEKMRKEGRIMRGGGTNVRKWKDKGETRENGDKDGEKRV